MGVGGQEGDSGGVQFLQEVMKYKSESGNGCATL